MCQSFADVNVTEDGVDTLTFLEAAEGVVKLFSAPLFPKFRIDSY